ncbi:hypothetical protein J6590_055036 [Homalodisca vitripennis]|nr:hypothetical protein J6590_055036 [Homalodisca vitripennis]
MVMSPGNKGRPALNQSLQSKQAGSGTSLLRLARTSEIREQTPPTPTVISHSRLDLSNCPRTPESRHLRLVMCRSWTDIHKGYDRDVVLSLHTCVTVEGRCTSGHSAPRLYRAVLTLLYKL